MKCILVVFFVCAWTLNCVVFWNTYTLWDWQNGNNLWCFQNVKEKTRKTMWSIYATETTITHIIAFTITINYPNIVNVLDTYFIPHTYSIIYNDMQCDVEMNYYRIYFIEITRICVQLPNIYAHQRNILSPNRPTNTASIIL